MHLLDGTAITCSFDAPDLAAYLGGHGSRHLGASGGALGEALTNRSEEHGEGTALADLGRHEGSGKSAHHGALTWQQDRGGNGLPLAVSVGPQGGRRMGRTRRSDWNTRPDRVVVPVVDDRIGQSRGIPRFEASADRNGELSTVEPTDLRASNGTE